MSPQPDSATHFFCLKSDATGLTKLWNSHIQWICSTVWNPTFSWCVTCMTHWLYWSLYFLWHDVKYNILSWYTIEYSTCHLCFLLPHTRIKARVLMVYHDRALHNYYITRKRVSRLLDALIILLTHKAFEVIRHDSQTTSFSGSKQVKACFNASET